MPPSYIETLEGIAEKLSRPLGGLCGTQPTLLTGMNGILFRDPSKYEASTLEAAHSMKLAYFEHEFSSECQKAYDYGRQIFF
ncbi:MAG: hypothetical protein V8R80_09010 [Eubacterium sp.]